MISLLAIAVGLLNAQVCLEPIDSSARRCLNSPEIGIEVSAPDHDEPLWFERPLVRLEGEIGDGDVIVIGTTIRRGVGETPQRNPLARTCEPTELNGP